MASTAAPPGNQPPILGTDPTDHLAVTLSLQLRAILHRAGLVASPDLPSTPVPPSRSISAPVERRGDRNSVAPATPNGSFIEKFGGGLDE